MDVTEKRDVTYASDYEEQERTTKDQDSEQSGDGEGGSDERIVREILPHIVPVAIVLLGKVDGVESKGVDDLTGTICEQQSLPTWCN